MRRTVSGTTLALALALVAAPLAVAPSPAHATLTDPWVSSVGNISVGTGDSGPCVLEPGGVEGDQDAAYTENGAWTTVTAVSSGVVSDPAEPADRTTVSSTTTTRIRSTAEADSFRTLDVEATITASRHADQGDAVDTGTDCNAWVAGDSASVGQVVVREAGWFTITVRATQPGTDGGSVAISDNRFGTQRATSIYTGSDPVTARVFRPAGAYHLRHDFDLVAADNQTVTGAFTASVRFTPAGSAEGRAAGPGRRLVTLPDTLSCGSARADLRLTKKAKALRGIRSAVFTATGAKKVKVARLKAGRKVALKGVELGRPVTVTGTFTTTKGRTLTVERTYVSCR
jgi:hypothetical protein